MAKKTIDPQPIIKVLAERCLKAKGLECTVLGEVIDMLKTAPHASSRVVVCEKCQFCKFEPENEKYHCRSQNGLHRTVLPDEFCSYGERALYE